MTIKNILATIGAATVLFGSTYVAIKNLKTFPEKVGIRSMEVGQWALNNGTSLTEEETKKGVYGPNTNIATIPSNDGGSYRVIISDRNNDGIASIGVDNMTIEKLGKKGKLVDLIHNGALDGRFWASDFRHGMSCELGTWLDDIRDSKGISKVKYK